MGLGLAAATSGLQTRVAKFTHICQNNEVSLSLSLMVVPFSEGVVARGERPPSCCPRRTKSLSRSTGRVGSRSSTTTASSAASSACLLSRRRKKKCWFRGWCCTASPSWSEGWHDQDLWSRYYIVDKLLRKSSELQNSGQLRASSFSGHEFSA